MKLSIVIPCFNQWNFTKSCLNDLSKLIDHEIIIIDDGSTDETFNNLSSNKDIVYHRSLTNQGFAKSVNIGYRLATSDNILFLNNDIRVKSNHSDWTDNLIKHCQFGLVGPTMGQLDKQFNFIKEANQYLTGKSYMSGWCLASSKEVFKKLEIAPNQLFTEEFVTYFEDTDLSFRARQLKIPMQVIDVPVVHFGKVSSKQLNTHKLYSEAKKKFTKKWETCQF